MTPEQQALADSEVECLDKILRQKIWDGLKSFQNSQNPDAIQKFREDLYRQGSAVYPGEIKTVWLSKEVAV